MKRLFVVSCIIVAFVTSIKAQVSFGETKKFNDGWLFSLSDSTCYKDNSYADNQWRKLDLPHDWSVEGTLSPSLASCTGYLPAGIAWYRKHFTVEDCTDPSAECQYIYFEGVYNRSEVYLNGQLLGVRPSGFASFMYDMTPYIKDGDNVLSVRVDHSRYADSRWYTGSGIYRDVWSVSSQKTHISQWGVGYETKKLTDASATVTVNVSIDNAIASLQILAELCDANGKVVARKKSPVAKGVSSLTLSVSKPFRWSLNNPYLYTLKTQLLQGGKLLDKSEIEIGLRSIEFNADKGFFLNGENMKIKGVCLHHDAGVLGSVVPTEVWERRLVNLKKIGVNAIRCSHNPHAPILYEMCDRLGLLVMDEASDEWEFPKRKWVEGWNVGTPSYDGTFDFFEEWIDRDVTDMVRRDRNHPSIILWSIGNEVDYPNDPYSHPILDGGNAAINQPMYGGYKPDAPNAERIGNIAKRLAACVRAVDTSRPVTGALAGVVMSNQTEYPEAVDVVGYNYTENRYAEDHVTYPNRVIYGSENGVGYEAWCSVRDNEYISGQFIWTGTDYLGESGRWPSRGLHTGLLDFGSYAKPRGQFRASLWLETPFTYAGTYLNRPRRGDREWLSIEAEDIWNYEEGQSVRVVCYTNAPQAKLMLNGRQIGETKPYDLKTGIIYWDIPFTPGQLDCIGCDENGKELSHYLLVTTGRPYKIRASVDNSTLSSDKATAHIEVEVLDEQDNVVKLADNLISCTVEGPIKLLGLENSSNTDMSSYQARQRRVFGGRLLAYVQSVGGKGIAKIKFTSPLLKSEEVIIEIK